jgi:cytochrome b subunit of formate dehydrogenase
MVHAMIATQADYSSLAPLGCGLKSSSGTGGWRALTAMALLFAAVNLPVAGAEKSPNSSCLECHSDKTLSKTNAAQKEVSLFVDEAKFVGSVHSTNTCASCHADISDKHPDDEVPAKPVNCSSCHEPEAKDYTASIHGASHSLGASGAANCTDCHGKHDMLSATNTASPVYKMNLPKTCANCHSNEGVTREYRMRYPQAANQYQESIHGRALMEMGLIVAPSCNDCHGVHDIKRAVDRDSPIHGGNVAKTCGKCHVKVEEIYNQSVHGRLVTQGKNGPVCSDCHTAHEVETPKNGHFKMASDKRCGKCHEDRLEHYRDTYHGKAMALGKPNVASDVAACYDCHGHHDVLPPSDPKSRLSKQNILGTCKRCHPNATEGFTSYQPHANPLDRKNYPALNGTFLFMTALLVSVFVFFGGHTLAWLVRAFYLYLHDSKKFREAKIATQTGGEWFTRFAPFERFLHFLVVTSFLLLVITGMPLKFYYTNWARTLFGFLGGAETSRALHRFGAVVTFLYFGLHVASLLGKAWKGRKRMRDPQSGKLSIKQTWGVLFGPDSMIPTLQDWRDFVAHNKWFFGRGPKPEFDRWTYWEKFDYFAVFWGVFIIGASGLMMWFPDFFTRFMPGWVINIALIVHSDEALLAAGFIFSIHFFNTHFRIEKFPMDTVIFSGRVSKNEMLHERRRWYDRLLAEGRLDDFRVRDEWLRWRTIARTFGYIFFGLGVVLLVLIIYAMVTRLAH